jgi:pyridoxine kinase
VSSEPSAAGRTVLSIQSSVAYGHVGNNAAVFPLQRLGFEVWPVNTVQFSNHTGYGSWRGPVLPASDVSDVLAGVRELDVLGRCDAVLSGYQGAADVGAVILDAVAAVKAANPAAVYCADPVLGDRWCGFYVQAGIPEFMRDHVIPAADITTPNHFELEYLAGRPVADTAGLLAAVDVVRAAGPRIVLATSIELADSPPDRIGMAAASAAGTWLVSTPRLDLAAVSGAGDLTAALFLAHLLATSGDVPVALARTASSVFGVLEVTAALGWTEMALVAAQDQIADPPERFAVTRLR